MRRAGIINDRTLAAIAWRHRRDRRVGLAEHLPEEWVDAVRNAAAPDEAAGADAEAGVGHSPVDRRWDGVSMDKTLGAYSILACRKAMDEAGVTPDQIDGVICCDSHIAGDSGGSASQ